LQSGSRTQPIAPSALIVSLREMRMNYGRPLLFGRAERLFEGRSTMRASDGSPRQLARILRYVRQVGEPVCCERIPFNSKSWALPTRRPL